MNNIDNKHMAIINYHVGKYAGSDVPRDVLMSKAKLIYADTAKSYDPSKGTFEAYLNKNLMGLNRFVNSSMQIRMPEYKQQKTREVMDAIRDQYGDDEDVDYKHMGSLLGLSPKSIKSIYAGARRTIVSDPTLEEYVRVGIYDRLGGSAKEDLYNSLPSKLHRDVYDYAMGEHGKQVLNTNRQIAMRLGISESYVRKIKEDVLAKLQEL